MKDLNVAEIVEKVEKVIDALPPKAKTAVVILFAGGSFCLCLSEACKSATVFAKEGAPLLVENVEKGISLFKLGDSAETLDTFSEAQIVDASPAA